MANYLTTPLDGTYEKATFTSGNEHLDNYIRKQASQDVKRKLASCFVLADGKRIQGFYTLSNAGIPKSDVPESIQKKIPRAYESLPVTLLGRLAVNEADKGKGFGAMLLIDALKRAFEATKVIGSIAVVVDPIDENAVRFYEKYGFIQLPDSGKMFFPMNTIKQLFS